MTRSEALLVFVGPHPPTTSALTAAVLDREDLDHEATHPWSLNTKYYDADISVRMLEVESSLPAQPDACVLVIPARDAHSLASVQRWWEDNEVDGNAVRLLAAYGAEEWASDLEAARAWCAEELIELVGVPALQEERRVAGEGVDRIHEALQAHMWPGLRLKSRPQCGPVGGVGTGAAAADRPSLPLASRTPAIEPQDNPFLRDLGEDECGCNGEDELDASLHLDEAFRATSGLRERLAGLAPEERRAAAENTLMGLLELLGFDDEDDDGSNHDEGERAENGDAAGRGSQDPSQT